MKTWIGIWIFCILAIIFSSLTVTQLKQSSSNTPSSDIVPSSTITPDQSKRMVDRQYLLWLYPGSYNSIMALSDTEYNLILSQLDGYYTDGPGSPGFTGEQIGNFVYNYNGNVIGSVGGKPGETGLVSTRENPEYIEVFTQEGTKNPAVDYIVCNGTGSWLNLGNTILSYTGADALFQIIDEAYEQGWRGFYNIPSISSTNGELTVDANDTYKVWFELVLGCYSDGFGPEFVNDTGLNPEGVIVNGKGNYELLFEAYTNLQWSNRDNWSDDENSKFQEFVNLALTPTDDDWSKLSLLCLGDERFPYLIRPFILQGQLNGIGLAYVDHRQPWKGLRIDTVQMTETMKNFAILDLRFSKSIGSNAWVSTSEGIWNDYWKKFMISGVLFSSDDPKSSAVSFSSGVSQSSGELVEKIDIDSAIIISINAMQTMWGMEWFKGVIPNFPALNQSWRNSNWLIAGDPPGGIITGVRLIFVQAKEEYGNNAESGDYMRIMFSYNFTDEYVLDPENFKVNVTDEQGNAVELWSYEGKYIDEIKDFQRRGFSKAPVDGWGDTGVFGRPEAVQYGENKPWNNIAHNDLYFYCCHVKLQDWESGRKQYNYSISYDNSVFTDTFYWGKRDTGEFKLLSMGDTGIDDVRNYSISKHQPEIGATWQDIQWKWEYEGKEAIDNIPDCSKWAQPVVDMMIQELIVKSNIYERVDLIVHMGDVVYGIDFPEWDFYMMMMEPIASKVPIMYTVGNHDTKVGPQNPDCGSAYMLRLPMHWKLPEVTRGPHKEVGDTFRINMSGSILDPGGMETPIMGCLAKTDFSFDDAPSKIYLSEYSSEKNNDFEWGNCSACFTGTPWTLTNDEWSYTDKSMEDWYSTGKSTLDNPWYQPNEDGGNWGYPLLEEDYVLKTCPTMAPPGGCEGEPNPYLAGQNNPNNALGFFVYSFNLGNSFFFLSGMQNGSSHDNDINDEFPYAMGNPDVYLDLYTNTLAASTAEKNIIFAHQQYFTQSNEFTTTDWDLVCVGHTHETNPFNRYSAPTKNGPVLVTGGSGKSQQSMYPSGTGAGFIIVNWPENNSDRTYDVWTACAPEVVQRNYGLKTNEATVPDEAADDWWNYPANADSCTSVNGNFCGRACEDGLCDKYWIVRFTEAEMSDYNTFWWDNYGSKGMEPMGWSTMIPWYKDSDWPCTGGSKSLNSATLNMTYQAYGSEDILVCENGIMS